MIRNTLATAALAAGLATGANLIVASAANAAPSSDVVAYALSHGEGFCAALGAYPTRGSVLGTAEWISEHGFSFEEAGSIIALSMYKYCPENQSTVRAIVAAG